MSALDRFIDACQQIFGNNLVCILLLGSVHRGDSTPFSDIDLIMILNTMDTKQVTELRSVVRSLEMLIDCSILCVDEIPKDPNNFRLGSHGCYQLELVLKRAQCVLGINILLTLPQPDVSEIRKSLVEKITEYTWWTRRMFVESNRERSLEMNYKLNSRIVKMVRDFLYLKLGDDIDESAKITIAKFVSEYGAQLTNQEKIALKNLARVGEISRNASNMSDEYFLVRYSLVNKIYKWTIKFVI